MTRAAEVRASSFDEADNTIELVFTTGAKVRRYSWSEGAYDEELVVDGGSVRLGRLNAGAPFLDTHSDYRLASVLGSVVPGSARVEKGKGYAKVVLSKRDEVRGVVQDIRDGVIRNVSVGYRYHKVEKTDGQDGDPALWRVVDWEPLEISAVPIPADPGAQVRSSGDGEELRHGFTLVAAAEPEANEDTRAIRSLAARHDIPDLAERAISAGLTLPEFRAELLGAIQQKEDTMPTQSALAVDDRVHVSGPNGGDRRGEAVANAILHRADPSTFALSDAGRDFHGMSLIELARDSLETAGVNTRGWSRIDIADRALAGATRSGGLHSTSDFPMILSAVANKTLRAGYEAAPQTFRPLVREVSAPDFKPINRLQLGEAPQLEKVNEHGEFKRGTLGEGKESYQLLTYGKIVAITRQAVVNDDLGAFTRIPRMFGVQAANLESDLVWAQIVGNPIMGDGVSLFHANHANLGTAGGISDTTIAEAFKLMRLQKGLDGKTLLNLTPSYLIVPVNVLPTAMKFLTASTPAMVATQQSNIVPEYLRTLTPISEPRLDSGFTNPATGAAIAGNSFNWFMAGDRAQIDTVEIAYLEGKRGAYTETRIGFDIDGVEVKVRLDVGAGAIDFRGFTKNPAAGL
ncbi:prohead protease/major capsid protein fusion protein [Bosea vestrisii]|uniref:Prohead protease/major capsid protein fusion protein n=2 Tax=Bosea vestrisii TaxID=151416 RepID=A0ABW0H5L6_9HYPH